MNEKKIERLKKKYNYRIIKNTKTSVIFEVTKRFSVGWFIFWSIFAGGCGLIGYVIYYACKKDKSFIEVMK